jgi:hypothetical protein
VAELAPHAAPTACPGCHVRVRTHPINEISRQSRRTIISDERGIAGHLHMYSGRGALEGPPPASVRPVDKSGAQRLSMPGADLEGADLSGCDLSGADLTSAHLAGADLRNTRLIGAVLWEADLSGAKMAGALLCGASLVGADLWRADLRGAELCGADLSRADMTGVRLDSARVDEADLRTALHLSREAILLARLTRRTLLPPHLSSDAGVRKYAAGAVVSAPGVARGVKGISALGDHRMARLS